jgi:hypothetical protein
MLPGGPIPAVEAINWVEEQTISQIPDLDINNEKTARRKNENPYHKRNVDR